MRVGEIRDGVIAHLRAMHPDPYDTLIRCELGLCLGETRVDVAAVNGAITGWEIKSAQDRLTRLPRQVELYGRVLDFAIIVVSGRHASSIEAHVPDWWGIADVIPSGDASPKIDFRRPPATNPSIDPFAVAQLLWRDEAFDLLRARHLHKGMSRATRWQLWQVLASRLTVDELRQEVRDRLKVRQDW